MYDREKKIWQNKNFSSIYNPKASLGQHILHALRRGGNQIAEISDDFGTQWSFNQILSRSVQVAISLERHGIKKGDICTLISRNNPDLTPVVLGCFFLGAPVHPLNTGFDQNEMNHMLGLTKPKFIFVEEDVLEKVKVSLSELKLDSKVFVFTSDGNNVNSIKNFFKSIVTQEILDNYVPNEIPDTSKHIGLILCSSGTTGFSKGVCLSQAQIISQFVRSFPSTSNHIIHTFSSVFWITGMIFLVQGTFDGALRIVTSKPFSPEYFCELVQKYKISYTHLIPPFIFSCVESKAIAVADLSSMKLCITGGIHILESIRVRFEKALGENAKVMPAYGSTELGSCSSYNHPMLKADSVGVLQNENMAKIVDEDGNSVGPNEMGEIHFKHPYMFLEYYDNEEETRKTKGSGWLNTGDLGYIDDEGFLFISGRRADLIRYKEYQIAPVTIEAIIQERTGLSQVCAVAVEDRAHVTDLPAAVIVRPKDFNFSEAEIIKILEESLTDEKTLRGGIYFVDAFPKTHSGKVQRRLVKELAKRLYEKKSEK